jgi:hypothetical protein
MKETEGNSDESCQQVDSDQEDSVYFCDYCYRVTELRRILFSVYCVAIESLLMNTDLATERLSENSLRRSSSLFSVSERVPSSSTSTPKHKIPGGSPDVAAPFKFKIPESEITERLSYGLTN